MGTLAFGRYDYGMNSLIPEYNSTGLLGGIRLFLYEKKIVYLSQYRNGAKEATAGYIRLLREKQFYTLDIHIRSNLSFPDGEYPLILLAGNKEIAWGSLSVKGGSAITHRQLQLRRGMLCVGQEEYREEEWKGIVIPVAGQSRIAGYFRELGADLHAADQEQQPHINRQGEDPEERKMKVEEPVFEDKWKQLQKNYQTVHPFGDQRIFLSIGLKDFVILQAPFQKLVNNSFLLHGFYNYRHLILGPDKELGGGENIRYYLGVPGTYFEREKMVAVMFGFEGFECDGAVEIGKFGYYMRRVEL